MRTTLFVMTMSLLACGALAGRPVSAEEDKAKVAVSFVNAWNQHDVPSLLALTDARELAHRIGLPSVDEAGARKLVEQEFRYRETLQETARLTRTTSGANQVLAMVRIDGKAPGDDYLELVLEPRAPGGYRVVDSSSRCCVRSLFWTGASDRMPDCISYGRTCYGTPERRMRPCGSRRRRCASSPMRNMPGICWLSAM